jgi:hypothetical protein
VEFEAAGSKYFARETSPNLQTRNSANWGCIGKKRSTVIVLCIFQRDFTTSWKHTEPVQRLSNMIVVSSELFEISDFSLNY